LRRTYLIFMIGAFSGKRSLPAANAQFGLYSEHFLQRRLIPYADSELGLSPWYHFVGIQGSRNLGEHWAVGLSMSYWYRYFYGDSRYRFGSRFIWLPPEYTTVETESHYGAINLFGRWYAQERRAPARVFVQLGFETHLTYWGSFGYPEHPDLSRREPRIHRFAYDSNALSFGSGLQYRLGKHWSAETAIMMRWWGGSNLDFGVQLGMNRVLTE
ncbi:MAG: hypothetical protein AAFQ68_11670, partial [Bacteroidota bacterium]